MPEVIIGDGDVGDHQPQRDMPAQKFMINGGMYDALDLSDYEVGDEVQFLIKGTTGMVQQNSQNKGARDLGMEISSIENRTPRKDLDPTGRVIIKENL